MQPPSGVYDADAEMDWDPSPQSRSIVDTELRPPTFFPREEPTGLEGLFEDWNWLDDERGLGTRGKLARVRGREEALLKNDAGVSSWVKDWLRR